MSARELTEWMAYEQVSGTLGSERFDLLFSIVAATIANALSRKRFDVKDFLPMWDRPVRQSWQEQLAIVQAANKYYGGSVRGGSV